MSPFDYVTILISIILGLGITQILIGLAEIIRRWGRITFYWPHALWIILGFIMHIREWWFIYQLKSFNSWSLPYFLFIALYPITLFIFANLLFPQNWRPRRFDMQRFYHRNWQKLFGIVLALALISIAQNTFVYNLNLQEQAVEILIAVILAVFLAVRPSNHFVHFIFPLVLFVILVTILVLQREELVITI